MYGVQKLKSFINNSPLRKAIYKHISPVITDVSLRDGLQGLSPETINLTDKISIFHDIYKDNIATNIEVGSVVNTKLVPVMSDVPTLYNYCGEFIDDHYSDYRPNLHIIVPNMKYLKKACANNMNNFAFLSSVSNDFQKQNANMSLTQVKNQLHQMTDYLNTNGIQGYKKLYLSCINVCPIRGKIDNNFIGSEIVYYSQLNKFNEICLSDTCGELTLDNFREIIAVCRAAQIPMDKLSLHLHVNPYNNQLESIIRYALNNKIHRFDMSSLSTGGCHMTLEAHNSFENLNYELFYSILARYIDDLAQKEVMNYVKN